MAGNSGAKGYILRFITREHSGAIAIELALLAPILLLLVFGTLRIGHAIGVQHALSQLAASAARQALPALDADRRERAVRDYVMENAEAFALLDATRIDLEVAEAAQSLHVLVSMDVSHIPDVPIVSAAFRFPNQQTARAVIAVQH